jgi:hypothetical protein
MKIRLKVVRTIRRFVRLAFGTACKVNFPGIRNAFFLPASKLRQPTPFEVTPKLQDSMMSAEKDKKAVCAWVIAMS